MATSSETVEVETTVQVKLLIDSKGQRVLFAEAGKDFCDFLFTLLSLPVATVIRLLSDGTGMVGTLGTLYNSFASLSDSYIEPHVDKNSLLNPSGPSASLLRLQADHSPPRRTFYVCHHWPPPQSVPGHQYHCNTRHVSDDPSAVCPTCNGNTETEIPFVAGPGKVADAAAASGGAGFVKGVVTYMVMDDLEVKPMSTISSIAMLNKFNVKEIGDLQEKTVSLGLNEGVKLLKASLLTKNVLSTVFLGK